MTMFHFKLSEHPFTPIEQGIRKLVSRWERVLQAGDLSVKDPVSGKVKTLHVSVDGLKEIANSVKRYNEIQDNIALATGNPPLRRPLIPGSMHTSTPEETDRIAQAMSLGEIGDAEVRDDWLYVRADWIESAALQLGESLPWGSVDVKVDFVDTKSGEMFPVILDHVLVTNKPATNYARLGALTKEDAMKMGFGLSEGAAQQPAQQQAPAQQQPTQQAPAQQQPTQQAPAQQASDSPLMTFEQFSELFKKAAMMMPQSGSQQADPAPPAPPAPATQEAVQLSEFQGLKQKYEALQAEMAQFKAQMAQSTNPVSSNTPPQMPPPEKKPVDLSAIKLSEVTAQSFEELCKSQDPEGKWGAKEKSEFAKQLIRARVNHVAG